MVRVLRTCWSWAVVLSLLGVFTLSAQELGKYDRESPGDEMIQAYLREQTATVAAKFASDVKTLEDWQAKRPEFLREYYYMLGLSPMPEKTPLHATVTGKVTGEGYVVENLHYQSRPGLYVTGNLYRPAVVKPDEKLPAIFYVCGHSNRPRNGNKVAYQSHGIWFARHGYVCLIVDSLQLGEIAATHHGTYNLQRWWWHSRGYTPAGVEAWNGIRGIDYLISREDVDAKRIGVTGISGGGAATFWIAAADERVAAAAPVSGMADLESYIPNRTINGHCDCMFCYNTYEWPWTRIASLIAPRPFLFVNSDQDPIFPMDANERVNLRMERLYSLYGVGDRFDAVVSIGGHAYRKDIRQAAYRFFNSHFKGDARPITDSEVDIVSEGGMPGVYPIPPEKLRVFPEDSDFPRDRLNAEIDQHFVPLARSGITEGEKFSEWQGRLLHKLREVSFRSLPKEIAPAKPVGEASATTVQVMTEAGISIPVYFPQGKEKLVDSEILLVVLEEADAGKTPTWLDANKTQGRQVVLCETRGIGPTRWTKKNPPNYVERSHALLGTTVDTGRVLDVVAVVAYLKGLQGNASKPGKIYVAGSHGAGLIAAYAGLQTSAIDGVLLHQPPTSHMKEGAPQFLNVLRVGDVPEILGLLAPRTLSITGSEKGTWKPTQAAYRSAGAEAAFSVTP